MTDFSIRPASRVGRGVIDETLTAGDAVDIIGGPHYGGHAILEGIEDVPTPSGRMVKIARIRRPRAGVAYAFPDMIRRRS